ncbi:unnamed protein product [Closterium sp. NIES-54]
MASLRVLAFDHEGRPVAFDTWHDDLQQYLLCDIKDSVSLFDHVSGVAPAPPATADSATRSQWLTRDATARLAIRNHLPVAECTHFGQHRTAQALYNAVDARYSSPATAALGRLILPYLFPELSAFATVADLVTHLRTSDARYRATVPAEFLATNQHPMFITLYFIVSRLPDSFRSVRDHFLSLDPTSLTVDLLEQHLLAAETSAVGVGAARGTPRSPFFEGCSPFPLPPSFASAAAADVPVTEDVGAASTSAKRRSSKGKGGRGADWSEKEVKHAFRSKDKALGRDGQPKDLFEEHWDVFGKHFVKLVEGFSDTVSLPTSTKDAVTILLHKKRGQDQLENYRPIMLLSFTYKVLARVVADKMKKVLEEVISPEQYGFLPGRRLSDAVGLFSNIIEAAKNKDEDWYLLLVDFKKVFDSVSRGFLFMVLERMGFPSRFFNWVQSLHKDTRTSLLVNGRMGEAADVVTGVRQGCPLAHYLFLCAVEPLAQEAANQKLGLTGGDQRLAYLGYANDTT